MLPLATSHVFGQFGFNVTRVGGYQAGREPVDLVIAGDYAYCADWYGLSVWDLSEPEDPVEIARSPTPGRAMGVVVYETYAYIGDFLRGLAVFDISDPLRPELIGYLELGMVPGGFIPSIKMVVSDAILYLCACHRLWIISLEDPTNPEVISISDPPWPYITDIAVNGDIAYLSTDDYQYGLIVLNMENLQRPELIRLVECPEISAIEVRNNILYSVGDRWLGPHLTIYSLEEDPSNPEIIERFEIEASYPLLLDNDYAYATGGGNYDPQFLVIDISDPERPEVVGRLDRVVGSITARGEFIYGTRGSGRCGASYSNGNSGGILTISVDDPENPVIVNELLPDYAFTALDVVDDVVFIQDSRRGLAIIDINSPQNPSLISEHHYFDRSNQFHLSIVNYLNFIYMGASGRGISIFSIENLEEPELIRELNIHSEHARYRTSIFVQNGYMYVVGYLCSSDHDLRDQNLVVLNLEDPSDPQIVEWRQDARFATEYSSLSGDILYQVVKYSPAAPSSYVLVYSLAEPGEPELLGRWPDGQFEELVVYNHFAYVYHDHEIRVYSVENPIHQEFIRSLDVGVQVEDMCQDGNIIYLSIQYGDYGFLCMSIEDPENPEIVGFYDTPGKVWGFQGSDGYLYVCDDFELGIYDCAELHGIWDLQVSDDSHDFGEVEVDSSAEWEFTITNAARQAVEVLNVTVDSAAFFVGFDDTLTLEPDEETFIPVAFAPTESRNYTSALTIHTERRDLMVELSGTGIDLSVAQDELLPLEFKLYPAYPNPFNSVTRLTYQLPEQSHVTIEVYDIGGHLVETLVRSDHTAGSYSINWNGSRMVSGVYLIRFKAGSYSTTRKVVLMK